MTASEKILFDTNILVYVQSRKSRFYQTAWQWHQQVIAGEIQAVLAPQNLVEFFSLITNKKRVEKPLSPRKALLEVAKYQSGLFYLIYPSQATMAFWEKLIKKYQVKARRIFDVFLVATMLSNGVKKILTYNQKDFRGFKEIEVVNPVV